MIKDKILEIAKILEKYGQSVLNSATEEEINKFQTWAINEYGSINIDEYVYLVKLANGLNFNGLVIYSIKKDLEENIYNSNEIWHENENLKSYLFYADADIAWYCFDTINGVFCELDKPSGEVMQTYETFNDMIGSALDSVM